MVDLNMIIMGDHDATLDEAGRIAIPRDLRNSLEQGKVVLTRGADPCLWLYTAEKWMERMQEIVKNTDPDTALGREVLRRNIGYAHSIDVDKQGRILIPPTLREFAGLSKECTVVGQLRYIEIWDKERRAAHECSQDAYLEFSEKFAREKELKNAGNSPHAGIAGGDNAVSRSAGQG
ncbi:MAG: division/cell wall cluster transcriptional repressor MraZ [Treponema sp.]|jgi:MraZ protein|nr:division/cell wall cluster transcriptional repressor MraZ [Treponema sp.]